MLSKYHFPLSILLALFVSLAANAQSGGFQFVENKGQWDSRVGFRTDAGNGSLFLHGAGFTVLQHHPDDWKGVHESLHDHKGAAKAPAAAPRKVRAHALKVAFEGGNAAAQLVPDKYFNTYNNYFIGADPSKWAAQCRLYGAVTAQDVYPGIDVRYYSESGQIKYDIIVKPGADPSKIALRYDGAEGLSVSKTGELVVKTSVGEVRELYPYSYQPGEKGREEVKAKFAIKGNTVRFDLKGFDRSKPLVIDPTLIFSSLSGSTADNWGFTSTFGPQGEFFGGGISFGSGFPTSPGAFDVNFSPGGPYCGDARSVDMSLIKLSPDGSTREWATYLGGDGVDQPHSLFSDAAGNLVVTGRSNSGTSYPLANGGLIGSGGGFDIVVTKLNATGSALIGSRRIGGTNDDGVNIGPCASGRESLRYNYGDQSRGEVILDGAGNVYIASSTQSNNFPTQGAFQPSFGGGVQDAVVLKFSPSLNGYTFGSFLGGSANDAAYVLSLQPGTGNVFVAGGTESPNFPGAGPGSLAATAPGGVDGYVANISPSGGSLVRSTYIGMPATIDQVYGIQFDALGFPYVMGQTTSNAWPVINAAFSQTGGKQFIGKLQPDLSAWVYSTKFGTSTATVPNISPVAFLVDRCQNVYVSGWGGEISGSYTSAGTQGLTVTADAVVLPPRTSPSQSDDNDFYFFVLKKDAASQLYGSFFGLFNASALGDHVDGGTSRFDANGVIYQSICASCGETSGYPTTPGAWAPTKPASANCNLGMVKLALNLAGVSSALRSTINGVPRDTAGCLPLTVDFVDTLENAVSYEWDFQGDGVTDLTTTMPNASFTYTSAGAFRVRLIAVDSTTCNVRDTSYINIKVGINEAKPVFRIEKLLPCDDINYRFINETVALPGAPFTNTSFIWDFGDGSRQPAGINPVTHRYAAPGSYNVKLILQDSNYCNAPDSATQVLSVAINIRARFNGPAQACSGVNAEFENASDGGTSFLYDFGDGTTSTDPNPTKAYTNTGSTPIIFTIRFKAFDPNSCNMVDSATRTITVFPQPTAAFTVLSPQPPPENTPILFGNNSSPDAVRFTWLWGDGDSLRTTSRANLRHEFNGTRTYTTCLVAVNAAGCEDTVCGPVISVAVPAVDVPTAFRPLSGDANSVVMVRGFAIARMKFAIWNRWGQKVFESTSKSVGWNGRVNGVLQPMDVYAYTLEVEFSDGSKATRTGDITLLR